MAQRFLTMVILGLLTGSPAHASVYLLGPQDKVHVEIYEYPNMSGDYQVDATGTISIPLLGDFQAAGLTPQAFRVLIRQRLTTAVAGNVQISDTSTTVQVTQYRPFFILGDVETPGAYPFRPGLSVLEAVSLAGGFYRLHDPGLVRLARDTFAADGTLRELETRLLEKQYERVRLSAESSSDPEISFPSSLGSPELATALRNREQAVFEARRTTLDGQVGAWRKLVAFYQAEVGSLQKQIDLASVQLAAEQTELGAVQSLVDRGIATTTRGLEIRREVFNIESKQQELATQSIHAREGIAQAEQAIQALLGDRREQVTSALRDVDSTLRQIQAQIQTNQNLLYESRVLAPEAYANLSAASEQPLQFTILRDGLDVKCRDSDPVEPGDVLKVRYIKSSVDAGHRYSNDVTSAPSLATATVDSPKMVDQRSVSKFASAPSRN